MRETEYQRLMRMSDKCTEKALYYNKKHELDLCLFFRNASEGFKRKALMLNVGE